MNLVKPGVGIVVAEVWIERKDEDSVCGGEPLEESGCQDSGGKYFAVIIFRSLSRDMSS